MKTNRVIQASAYYPPHLGGQENAVHDLSRQLAAAGNDVHVLTSAVGGGPKGVIDEENLHVARLRGFVFGHAPIMPSFPVTLFRTAQANSTVHLHIGQAFTPEMVWLVSKLRRFKYIAQLHIDFEPSGPAGVLLPLYKQLILRHVLRSADAVITLNLKTSAIVRDVYGYTGKIHIMNNGIDEAYFALDRPPLAIKPPRTVRLLFVGRLSKQKNITTLLEALKLTKRNVHLDIVGDGEERASVEAYAARHKLSNVTVHGRLGRDTVMDFYKKSDALILPSLYEAQPLVLLEAMAARMPIIGTNVIGVAEHIKDIGIIVQPTIEGISEGIERYFKQYSLLPEMVERGRSVAEKFRWVHTLKKYEALYEEVSRN